LGEDTAQLYFPSARRLPQASARATFQLDAHHRQLCAIHFDVQHGDGSLQNVGKLQLHYPISLFLFPSDDIGPDGFRVAFDGFGGDLKAGQQ
jgi:hypothetical protein